MKRHHYVTNNNQQRVDIYDIASEHKFLRSFPMDLKYCYPSDGSVIDADTGKKTSMRISACEKLLEVQFRGNQATRVSGQMGGVYGQRLTEPR